MSLEAFNDALLELDAEIRRHCLDRNPTPGQKSLYEAHRKLLVTVGPLRMHMIAQEAGREAEGDQTALMLEILRRTLQIAEEAGVKRSDIVAVVNNETMEHA